MNSRFFENRTSIIWRMRTCVQFANSRRMPQVDGRCSWFPPVSESAAYGRRLKVQVHVPLLGECGKARCTRLVGLRGALCTLWLVIVGISTIDFFLRLSGMSFLNIILFTWYYDFVCNRGYSQLILYCQQLIYYMFIYLNALKNIGTLGIWIL